MGYLARLKHFACSMLNDAEQLILTFHARVRAAERQLRIGWIEQTARHPDWAEPDANDPFVERPFRAIKVFGSRILRVACVETSSEIRVISAMFDRNARRKR
jgi:Domain of unknown function (DUF4258)